MSIKDHIKILYVILILIVHADYCSSLTFRISNTLSGLSEDLIVVFFLV